VEGQKGKEYRLPTESEIEMAAQAEAALDEVFGQIPFGMPEEPTPKGGGGASRAFSVDGYGFDQWKKLFTPRQLLALGTFVKWTISVRAEIASVYKQPEWTEAIPAYLALQNDKVADYGSAVCHWHISGEKMGSTFSRFALPIIWDFTELVSINEVGGAYLAQLDWICRYIVHGLATGTDAEKPITKNQSAIQIASGDFDAVVTDPPYYDAIPYSDLMDFFYIWLRRSLNGLSEELDATFSNGLSPKWIHEQNDGELIDDASRHQGDRAKSKAVYEDGMARVFQGCGNALKPNGKLVVVFAHKHPDAWETLVSAIIRAGFVVVGSWPIQTEMPNRTRGLSSAALASSVWLVCRKRPATARPGWDSKVLEEMRENIRERLREYWDAGIRGPDFVWAATGPAMEAYSKHPVVRKANEPGTLTVSEFLTHVRRIVIDFVVGRVLSGDKADGAAADRLDEPTAYYLLHRHDFGMDEAPAGACILYAVSCGVSDRELAQTWDLIGFGRGKAKSADDDGEADVDADADSVTEDTSGNMVKLKTWAQRKGKSMGYEAPGGKPVPLIDRVHRLMHLWKAGDLSKVDGYIDDNGLRRQELFKRLLQSLIELSPQGSEERSLMESISNHLGARGAMRDDQMMIRFADDRE
jgi:putative DNA methylase